MVNPTEDVKFAHLSQSTESQRATWKDIVPRGQRRERALIGCLRFACGLCRTGVTPRLGLRPVKSIAARRTEHKKFELAKLVTGVFWPHKARPSEQRRPVTLRPTGISVIVTILTTPGQSLTPAVNGLTRHMHSRSECSVVAACAPLP